jgi:hypothetical protein
MSDGHRDKEHKYKASPGNCVVYTSANDKFTHRLIVRSAEAANSSNVLV